ncbi:hypothetical protein [Pseudoalteromonas phage PH357]|nr:hypothetical protein [Pseudoalteromonas phage PH357]
MSEKYYAVFYGSDEFLECKKNPYMTNHYFIKEDNGYFCCSLPARVALSGDDYRFTKFISLIEEAITEANKAMVKFPQPNYVLLKVAEEAGEVVKEGVHCSEGRGDYTNLRCEIKQTIAMLYRLYVEGDETIGLESLIGEEKIDD